MRSPERTTRPRRCPSVEPQGGEPTQPNPVTPPPEGTAAGDATPPGRAARDATAGPSPARNPLLWAVAILIVAVAVVLIILAVNASNDDSTPATTTSTSTTSSHVVVHHHDPAPEHDDHPAAVHHDLDIAFHDEYFDDDVEHHDHRTGRLSPGRPLVRLALWHGRYGRGQDARHGEMES